VTRLGFAESGNRTAIHTALVQRHLRSQSRAYGIDFFDPRRDIDASDQIGKESVASSRK
jgi:hypothetical protein